jgi:hypothetical protein
MVKFSFGEQDDAVRMKFTPRFSATSPLQRLVRTSSSAEAGSTSGGAMRAVDTNLLVRLLVRDEA